jgi:hypothetical protein
MNDKILKIRTYKNHSNSIEFAGTLRNEKQFDLFQKVFIKSGDEMYECTIVGVELPPESNPDYIYKIKLPMELIEKRKDEFYIKEDEIDRISRRCDSIFSTIEEAKESAMEKINRDYELNKENIEKFFDKYKNK